MTLSLEVRKKLAEHRKRLSLTQAEAAQRAGVDQAMLSMVERGKKTPSLPTLEKMAAAVGLRVEVLLKKAK